MTGISCTICKSLTPAILSPTVNDFVNLGTSHPSLPSSTGLLLTNGTASYFDPFLPEEINCSICPKNPTQKSHAGPIVWAYNFITSWLCTWTDRMFWRYIQDGDWGTWNILWLYWFDLHAVKFPLCHLYKPQCSFTDSGTMCFLSSTNCSKKRSN